MHIVVGPVAGKNELGCPLKHLHLISPAAAEKRLAELEVSVPLSVSKAFANLPVGSRLQFFLQPKGSLGGETPLEALTDGKLDQVLIAAEGFAER